MSTLTEFLTSKEVFLVIIIAISICGIATIYYVFERMVQKHKEKKLSVTSSNKAIKVTDNRIEIEPVLDQIITEIPKSKKEEVVSAQIDKETVNVGQVIPIVEEEQEKKDIKPIEKTEIPTVENIFKDVKEQVEIDNQNNEILYTDIEPNKEEAKEEIRKATEELLKTQELQKQEMIDLAKFEEEQEENAIISLEELYKKGKDLYETNEVTQYEDEGNEPISLADLEARMNKIKMEAIELEKEDVKEETKPVEEIQKVVKLDDFNSISANEAYSDDKIFKSSPIISPIFGIEKTITTNDMELENTANYEKLDEEIKKTNEFLRSLKELQKKLE